MTFLWPFMGLFLPLPFLVYFLSKARTATKARQALYVPFFDFLKKQGGQFVAVNQTFLKIIFFMAWSAFVVALMRPQFVGDPIFIPQNARSMMLALDVSGSMAEQDFTLDNHQASRLYIVKTLADDFLQKRTGDQVGLVLFGSEAYVYAPLTADLKTARDLLQEVGFGIAGQQTALGDAIGLSLKSMTDVPAASKVLIVLSDGYSNQGQLVPARAAELARDMGVKIYTIGIGTNQSSSELDEQTLKQVADITGGQYFKATTASDLKNIYQRLDELEPIDLKNVAVRPVMELFFGPLGLAMILFFLGVILKGRRA